MTETQRLRKAATTGSADREFKFMTTRKPIEDTRDVAKERRCLSCDKDFFSESASVRICPSCKRSL